MIGGGLARGIDREKLRKQLHPRRIVQQGVVTLDVRCEEAFGPRLDNGRTEGLEVRDGALDDLDVFQLRCAEDRLVHVLAHHADAHALERLWFGKRLVRLFRHAADGEGREFVLRIIAGDHAEHARRIRHRTRDGAGAGVDADVDHTDA